MPKNVTDTPILIVGYGSIGSQYARALTSAGFNNTKICPVSRRNHSMGLIEQLAFTERDNYEFDLVIVCTDTIRHTDDYVRWRPQCQKILIEKPVAATVEQALATPGLLSDPDAYVSAPLRFHPGFARVRHLLEKIGPITSAKVSALSWMPDWRPKRDPTTGYWADPSQGGVLRDLIHEIDYACNLLGYPLSLSATLSSGLAELGIDVDARAHVKWMSSNDVHVQIHLDYTARTKQRTLLVQGERGHVFWDVNAGMVRYERSFERTECSMPFAPAAALLAQVVAILHDEKHGKPPSTHEAARTLAVTEAARRSNEFEHDDVSVEYPLPQIKNPHQRTTPITELFHAPSQGSLS